MSSNLKVNNILPSTGDTVAVSGIASVTSSVSIASSCTATTFYGSGANLTNLPSQLTINNATANRVLTSDGGTTLNGESTLTYDGDGLLTMTSSSGPAELTLVAPSANDSGIYFNDGSNDGAISYDHSTRNMNFRANSQTKFRIEGDTKTLKIQRPDSSAVDIVLAKAQRWGYSNSWQGLLIGNPAVGNMSSLFLNYDPSSNPSGSFAGDGREIVVRKNAKMIVPNAADNAFYNAIEFNCGGSRDDGVSRFRQGIIVSNDAADGNVLDDYEEGSFTPTFVQGYNSVSYNANSGFYTKIGNHVSYSIYFYVLSGGGQNAEIRISLPFTTKNQQRLEEGAYIVYDSNFLSSSNDSISNCYIMSGRNYTYLRLFKCSNGASIKGNETLLGTGANNVYLLIKGFLTTA